MSDPYPQTGPDDAAVPARHGLVFRPANLILLLPLIGTLVPVFYNRMSPEWGGMPFFYWYQLVWIPVSAICSWIVYRATKSRGQR